jgi:hypothetical protein
MLIFKRVLLGVLATIFVWLFMDSVWEPMMWHRRTRQDSIAALAGAKTTEDLHRAVGGLGIFIPLRGGPWIAIRYNDSHVGMFTSLAIARDSEGGWFESKSHFCGSLVAYGARRRLMEGAGDDPIGADKTPEKQSRSNMETTLDAMYSSDSLESARQQLLKLGFKALEE